MLHEWKNFIIASFATTVIVQNTAVFAICHLRTCAFLAPWYRTWINFELSGFIDGLFVSDFVLDNEIVIGIVIDDCYRLEMSTNYREQRIQHQDRPSARFNHASTTSTLLFILANSSSSPFHTVQSSIIHSPLANDFRVSRDAINCILRRVDYPSVARTSVSIVAFTFYKSKTQL